MISLESKGNTIYTIAEKKLDKEDYKQLIPFLERKTDFKDHINWYFEMKDFEGWTAISAWEDLKIDIEYNNQLDKIAMVGGKEWQDWLTKLMKPFSNAEIKYFTQQQKQKAQNWIEH